MPLTGVPRAGVGNEALIQANASLESENSRLRALLAEAGLGAGQSLPASGPADEAPLESDVLRRRVTEAMPGIVNVFDLKTGRSVYMNRAVWLVLG